MVIENIVVFISDIAKWMLGVTGLVFLLTLFVNGFRYLLSSGGDGTDSAKKGIVNAIIGIVIVSFSYGIAVFIESTIKITVK